MELGREGLDLSERMEAFQILINSCRWPVIWVSYARLFFCVSEHRSDTLPFRIRLGICIFNFVTTFGRVDMRLCIRIREWLRFQFKQERLDTKVFCFPSLTDFARLYFEMKYAQMNIEQLQTRILTFRIYSTETRGFKRWESSWGVSNSTC